MFERNGPGLSISARINLALGAIVGLLILLEIFAVTGFKAGSERLSKFSAISDVAGQVIMIDRDAASMDRLARRYAGSGEEMDIKRAQEFADRIGASLAALGAGEFASEVKEDLRRMEDQLAAYVAAMQKMATSRVQRDDLVNWRLNGAGVKARASLVQIMHETAAAGDSFAAARAGLANDYLQSARLNTYKYLAMPSEQLVNAVDSQISALIKACEDLEGSVKSAAHKVLAAEASGRAQEYKTVFAQVAAATGTINSLATETLLKYGEGIRAIAGKVADSRRENMNGVREASFADTSRTTAIFSVAALLAIATGAAIALWTARSVVEPLRGLSEAIMRLSIGDTGIAVEGTHRRDEVGMLARSLENFRLSIIAQIEADRASRIETASSVIRKRLALEDPPAGERAAPPSAECDARPRTLGTPNAGMPASSILANQAAPSPAEPGAERPTIPETANTTRTRATRR
jgi:HAMP domain-containing protein